MIETKRIMRVGSAREFPIDVRIVAATHRDLPAMCEAGSFRQDLYYRLNGFAIEIPPLRERREDIAPLARHFLEDASVISGIAHTGITKETEALLRAYRWPGNIRELRNCIERAALMANGHVISPDHLPGYILSDGEGRSRNSAPRIDLDKQSFDDISKDDRTIKEKVKGYERELLEDALASHGGNQTLTAQALGMPLRTLVHKIRMYELKR